MEPRENTRHQRQEQRWRKGKQKFMRPEHFLRTEFTRDEWLCRPCSQFDRTNLNNKPLLLRKRSALGHERVSPSHQGCVAQWDRHLEKKGDMEWGAAVDDTMQNQVFDDLRWNMPDARKGRDFVKVFVEFWVEDVAAALEVNKGEKEKERARPTWADFFEGIEIESVRWDVPGDVYGQGGWGLANLGPQEEVKEEEHVWGRVGWSPGPEPEPVKEMQKGNRNEPDGDGWVVQAGRGRGRGRGRGNGRGRGKAQGGGGAQRTKKTVGEPRGIGASAKRRGGRGGGQSNQRQQVVPTTNDNVFAKLQVDDG